MELLYGSEKIFYVFLKIFRGKNLVMLSDIEQTRLIRRQQDELYEESLRADRDKVKRKREAEEEVARVKVLNHHFFHNI